MDEDARTVFCGNLSSQCKEDILYELFLQAGPLEKVHIPKDRDGNQKSFGFVTFKHSVSVAYAVDLFEGTTLFNRALTIKARNTSQDQVPPPLFGKTMIPNPNEILSFGNQVLMGGQMPLMGYNMMPMFGLPGMMPYPSQNHMNFQHRGKDDRHANRMHPYREHRKDRDNRPYDRPSDRREHNYRERDHQRHFKSHKSSHRERSRDDRRNYRNKTDEFHGDKIILGGLICKYLEVNSEDNLSENRLYIILYRLEDEVWNFHQETVAEISKK